MCWDIWGQVPPCSHGDTYLCSWLLFSLYSVQALHNYCCRLQMSHTVSVTTADAEPVEHVISHGNSHVTSQILPVMVDHLTYEDNEFNSDADDSDSDDDGGGGTNGAAADGVMNMNSTSSVVQSTTASLTSSLTDHTSSTSTNVSHSMTVRSYLYCFRCILCCIWVSCFLQLLQCIFV